MRRRNVISNDGRRFRDIELSTACLLMEWVLFLDVVWFVPGIKNITGRLLQRVIRGNTTPGKGGNEGDVSKDDDVLCDIFIGYFHTSNAF